MRFVNDSVNKKNNKVFKKEKNKNIIASQDLFVLILCILMLIAGVILMYGHGMTGC